MIFVVGLGVGNGDITLKGANAVKSCAKVYIKTERTATVGFFKENGIDYTSFDYLYDEAENFADLDSAICNVLLENGRGCDMAFCVNGSGAEDATAAKLSALTKVEFIYGGGYGGFGLTSSPDTSFSQYSAYDVVQNAAFFPDKRHTVIIKEIDGKLLAGEVKLALQKVYGDDKTVFLKDGEKCVRIALNELDRRNGYGADTVCVLPSETFLTAKRYDFADLIAIMESLLGENGCPWDKSQTHESIRINLIEEAYELIDAIDNGDVENMQEETGDVLLQAVFHAMLGKKGAEYDIYDALTGLCGKLVTRHTHIFGANKAVDAEEALKCWNAAKNIEKHYETLSDKLDKLPKNLPALLYAYKVQKIAVKCGFDWENIDGAYDKLDEEIAELKNAEGEDIVKEAGDVLFSAVNPLRKLKVEPELALRGACEKFINRFKYMENSILQNGEDIADADVREKFWNESKKIYK